MCLVPSGCLSPNRAKGLITQPDVYDQCLPRKSAHGSPDPTRRPGSHPEPFHKTAAVRWPHRLGLVCC